jgi:phosphate transport system permease protein
MIRPEDIKRTARGHFASRLDKAMKVLFGGNAIISIVVLALIMLSLFREGAGFFPDNLRNIQLYRLSGLEYVDIIRAQVEAHTVQSRALQALRLKQLQALTDAGKTYDEANAALQKFDDFSGQFDSAVDELRSLMSDVGDVATATRDKAKVNADLHVKKEQLIEADKRTEAATVAITEVDFAKEISTVTGVFPQYQQAARAMRHKLETLADHAPEMSSPVLQPGMEKFRASLRAYLADFPNVEVRLKSWRFDEPVRWYRTISSFLLGREWITNSFWQDWYGILPLLTGSVLVSLIALVIAVPFGVCAAVYVSEIAMLREQRIIKPCIEFISAIPSVVLGFFGIAVLGEGLRWISQQHWLAWIPGFPMSERLNALTAGCLLALMAVPTIFSLAEDALNNVPRGFKEASYALGANRLQTIVRILVPASLSGIISAVLLGFGRVIGETMVVLLCAGNRIQIPDFTQGPGAFVQPVHTMTGIIAQEMGEVEFGRIHYRALFMVGVVLFVISLGINFIAQQLVRRFKISIG